MCIFLHHCMCYKKLNEISAHFDFRGLGTKADPYDLMEMKEVLFVELCDYCGSNINHNGSLNPTVLKSCCVLSWFLVTVSYKIINFFVSFDIHQCKFLINDKFPDHKVYYTCSLLEDYWQHELQNCKRCLSEVQLVSNLWCRVNSKRRDCQESHLLECINIGGSSMWIFQTPLTNRARMIIRKYNSVDVHSLGCLIG